MCYASGVISRIAEGKLYSRDKSCASTPANEGEYSMWVVLLKATRPQDLAFKLRRHDANENLILFFFLFILLFAERDEVTLKTRERQKWKKPHARRVAEVERRKGEALGVYIYIYIYLYPKKTNPRRLEYYKSFLYSFFFNIYLIFYINIYFFIGFFFNFIWVQNTNGVKNFCIFFLCIILYLFYNFNVFNYIVYFQWTFLKTSYTIMFFLLYCI